MAETRTLILDSAERRVRAGGYNGFSFREIAKEIGIKSSSVHHHFPAKENLALSVAERYSEDFFAALGDPVVAGESPRSGVERYGTAFQSAFASSGRACLCGLLSNEAALLPDPVRTAVSDFVEANVAWLEAALSDGVNDVAEVSIANQARSIYCALEGAMGVAALTGDRVWIDQVVKQVCEGVSDRPRNA